MKIEYYLYFGQFMGFHAGFILANARYKSFLSLAQNRIDSNPSCYAVSSSSMGSSKSHIEAYRITTSNSYIPT